MEVEKRLDGAEGVGRVDERFEEEEGSAEEAKGEAADDGVPKENGRAKGLRVGTFSGEADLEPEKFLPCCVY